MAKRKSAVIQFLDAVWANANSATSHSWERLNHAMHNALTLAIGSGFTFHIGDFEHIANNYRFGRWSGDAEYLYSLAIQVENMSAVKSFEAWKGREPFIAENVALSERTGSYVHGCSSRAKERLHVGCSFKWQGEKVRVNSFSGQYVNVASYHREKLHKRFRLTRGELLAGRAEDRERRTLRERLEAASVNGVAAKIIKALGCKTNEEFAVLPIDRIRKVADKFAPLPKPGEEPTTITQEHLDAVRKAGACESAVNVYRVGMPLTEVTAEDWAWIKSRVPALAALRPKRKAVGA